MRFPYATLLLCLAVVVPYYLASGDTFYLPNQTLSAFSFGWTAPQGVVTYLFTHVGLMHLLGNLLPLLVFGLLVESVLPSLDVLLIFLLSGFISGLAFVLSSSNIFLAGASTGVAGLMSASVLLKPRKAVVLLLLIGLAVSFLLTPLISFALDFRLSSWNAEQQQLTQQAEQFQREGRTAEAAQVNQTIAVISQKVEQTQTGLEREKQTPSDFWVHALGALVGIAFVFFFKKRELKQGVKEFGELGDQVFSFFSKSSKRKL